MSGNDWIALGVIALVVVVLAGPLLWPVAKAIVEAWEETLRDMRKRCEVRLR